MTRWVGCKVFTCESTIQRLASHPALTSFEAADTVAKVVVGVGRETFSKWEDGFSR